MTLTSELTLLSFSGNDSTDVFSITFDFWNDSDIRAILVVDSTGVETVQTGGGVHYSLTGGSGSTGVLTMVTPPATGETLIIKSDHPDTQDTELPIGGKFPSQSVEQRLDIITRLIQQKEEKWGRGVLLKESTTLSGIEFPSPGASGFIKWNLAGTALEAVSGITAGSALTDIDGDTLVEVERTADDDTIRFKALGVDIATGVSTAFDFAVPVTTSSTIDGRDVATDGAKLDLIEDLADVTDTANVDAAGALMNSDFAANQLVYGNTSAVASYLTLAANSVPVRTTGNLTTANMSANEFLARKSTGDVGATTAAEARTILNVENGADVTDTANVTSAGALMDSEVDADLKTLSLPANTTISTFGASLVDDANAAAAIATLGLDADLATLALPASTTISAFGRTLIDDAAASNARTTLGLVIGTNVQAWTAILDATTASYTTTEESKLSGIESLADVTDTANVTSAGALMDSEVDADLKTLSLPANTTISAFGRTLIDDAAASNARSTLGLVIGTDVMPELAVVSQAVAEAGTSTAENSWTSQRVSQAINAQATTIDTAIAMAIALG